MHCARWLRARCGAVTRSTGQRAGRRRAGKEQSGCWHADAGTRLRARGCAHSRGQGSCALGARLRRGRGWAAARTKEAKRLRARGCAHAAARTRLRARGCAQRGVLLRAWSKAAARTGRGGCANGAGRWRAQGARCGAAKRICIRQNVAINCNLMLIMRCIMMFLKCVFQQLQNAWKGYDTFNCTQMCILKFILRACVYVHTRKVRLVSGIALDMKLINEASISLPHLRR